MTVKKPRKLMATVQSTPRTRSEKQVMRLRATAQIPEGKGGMLSRAKITQTPNLQHCFLSLS